MVFIDWFNPATITIAGGFISAGCVFLGVQANKLYEARRRLKADQRADRDTLVLSLRSDLNSLDERYKHRLDALQKEHDADIFRLREKMKDKDEELSKLTADHKRIVLQLEGFYRLHGTRPGEKANPVPAAAKKALGEMMKIVAKKAPRRAAAKKRS
jgi:hypothetical protein